jgi:hypothetical protein
MRRLISLVAVALVIAAMVLASVVPAFAVPPPNPPPQQVYHPGQYYCFDTTFPYDEDVANVPYGQVATYEEQGYVCFRQS